MTDTFFDDIKVDELVDSPSENNQIDVIVPKEYKYKITFAYSDAYSLPIGTDRVIINRVQNIVDSIVIDRNHFMELSYSKELSVNNLIIYFTIISDFMFTKTYKAIQFIDNLLRLSNYKQMVLYDKQKDKYYNNNLVYTYFLSESEMKFFVETNRFKNMTFLCKEYDISLSFRAADVVLFNTTSGFLNFNKLVECQNKIGFNISTCTTKYALGYKNDFARAVGSDDNKVMGFESSQEMFVWPWKSNTRDKFKNVVPNINSVKKIIRGKCVLYQNTGSGIMEIIFKIGFSKREDKLIDGVMCLKLKGNLMLYDNLVINNALTHMKFESC